LIREGIANLKQIYLERERTEKGKKKKFTFSCEEKKLEEK